MADILDFDNNPIPNPNYGANDHKVNLSYHVAKQLRIKWDKLRKGKLQKKDEDRCYIVDGREGTGKSVFTLQQAKYVDPTFDVDRICFTPDEFLKQIREAPEGGCIVFDEAFRGLSSKGSQSKINKMIVQAMMEMRQRNLIVFIVLPTIFLLELYAAVLRSNALFHVYKDKKGQRAFKTYNYQKKSILYNYGKKKGFSYSTPKVSVKDTGGRFYNIYSVSEKEYRKKKLESLQGTSEMDKEEEESKTLIDKKISLIKWFYFEKKYNKYNQTTFCVMAKSLGVRINRTTLKEYLDWGKERGIIDISQVSKVT